MVGVFGTLIGYGAISVWLARRFALRDEGLETLAVELPTLGHHIALTRHAPRLRRFREPVVLCHGLAANRFNMDFSDDGHGSDRLSLARSLSRLGFDAWVLELRGRGRAGVSGRPDWTIDDEVREDVPIALETVLALTGAERVFWVGHSKGALLQLLFQASGHPLAAKVAGMIGLAGPGLFRHTFIARLASMVARLFRRRPVPLVAIARLLLPIAGLVSLIGRRLYADLGNLDARLLRRLFASLPADIAPGVLRQLAHWLRHGHVTASADSSEEVSYRDIRVPALLIAGSRDWIAPDSSVRYVADRVVSSDVTLEIIGRTAGHPRDYGHGDLIVGRHAPDDVYPIIGRWLEDRALPVDANDQPPA